MGDPIINAQVDDINTTLGNIKVDLAALRPSIRAIKDAIAETYLTDTIENVPIASFNDGADEIPVRELEVAINPIQSLNGQTSPYPAGGGKNKFNNAGLTSTANTGVTVTATGFVLKVLSAGTYKSSTLKIDGDFAEKTIYFSATVVNSGSNNGSISLRPYDSNNAEISGHRLDFGANNSGTVKSATMPAGTAYINAVCYATTNNSAAVNDTATFTNIMLALENTAYAPYSNICPISGHTEVNVYRTGADLCPDIGWETGQYSNGVWENNITRKTSPFIPILPNTSYKISVDTDNSVGVCFINYNYFDANKTWLGNRNTNGDIVINGLKTHTLSISDINVRYLRVTIRRITEGDISSLDVATANPKVEQLTTYPISLGQTVYGGTLNVTTGELTIDRKELDLGSLGWVKSSVVTNGFVATSGLPDWFERAANNTTVIPAISDTYTATAYNNWLNVLNGKMAYRDSNSGKGIAICDASLASYYQSFDPAAFALAVAGKKIVYTLATPTTVQLTAAEVETLFGQNNIWSSSGNIIKLVYRVDYAHWLAEHTSA